MDGGLQNCPFLTPGATHATAGAPPPLPAVLAPSQYDEIYRSLMAHYAPQGFLEHLLVRELARHVTAAERWAAGTEALERQAALGSLSFAAGFSGPGDSGDDLALAAVYASDSVARSDRHSLARSRAIHRVVQALEQTQSRRLTELSAPTSPAFADEAACEFYLVTRLRERGRACPRCRTATGCVLRSRKVWECGGCGLQTGLRFGTVMADSALPLQTWFAAICAILDRPAIETSELAELLGVSRRATVRSLARRIREATATEEASELLAGLDGVARHPGDLSQAAAPTGVHRRKGRCAAQLEKRAAPPNSASGRDGRSLTQHLIQVRAAAVKRPTSGRNK